MGSGLGGVGGVGAWHPQMKTGHLIKPRQSRDAAPAIAQKPHLHCAPRETTRSKCETM